MTAGIEETTILRNVMMLNATIMTGRDMTENTMTTDRHTILLTETIRPGTDTREKTETGCIRKDATTEMMITATTCMQDTAAMILGMMIGLI